MNPEQQQALDQHIQAIAKILYEDTPPEQLTSLAGIEKAVQSQMQKHVMPDVGVFLSQLSTPAQINGRPTTPQICCVPEDNPKWVCHLFQPSFLPQAQG